jgi:hypothetical protein
MGTQLNGRGHKPVNRKPRKSYYVPVAQRRAAEAMQDEALQKAQREFAFCAKLGEPLTDYMEQGAAADQAAMAMALEVFASLTPEQRNDLLDQFHPGALLDSLGRRGGTLKACSDAQLLVLKKSADYNNTGANGGSAGTFKAQRDDYFPFGLKSYAQMIHTKSQRLISLANKGDGAIFESARDTMLDLINYASFGADWLDRDLHASVANQLEAAK